MEPGKPLARDNRPFSLEATDTVRLLQSVVGNQTLGQLSLRLQPLLSSAHKRPRGDSIHLQRKRPLRRRRQQEKPRTGVDPMLAGEEVSGAVERSIASARGGGKSMDLPVRAPLEQAFGVDLGHVNIHTDGTADRLNRSLHAQAFTAGNDIFFRDGEYNPASVNGQELLAHELIHTMQQGNANQIQRKLGFELETKNWYAWKYTGEGGVPSRAEAAERPIQVAAAERQKPPLHVANTVELQADDTPQTQGVEASNLEFVTIPFETETNSIAELLQMVETIRGIVTRLEGYDNRKTSAVSDQERYIFPEEHQLNRQGFLVSSATGGKTVFKMQATAGIRLSELPSIMQAFSKSVPADQESGRTARNYAPGRKTMGANSRQDRSLAEGPGWARSIIKEMQRRFQSSAVQQQLAQQHGGIGGHRGIPTPATPFDGNTENLMGFLSITTAYINNMALKVGEELKYWNPFMARNDFREMFDAIDPIQQAAFKASPALLVDSVIAVMNGQAGLQLQPATPVANRAYVKRPNDDPSTGQINKNVSVLQDVTIERWLGNLAMGGADMMAHDNIADVLKSLALLSGERTDTPAFADKVEQHEEFLESVGINQPDQDSEGESLFLFENRGIVNPFEENNKEVDIDQAAAIAVSYWMFFHRVEKTGPAKWEFGALG